MTRSPVVRRLVAAAAAPPKVNHPVLPFNTCTVLHSGLRRRSQSRVDAFPYRHLYAPLPGNPYEDEEFAGLAGLE